MSYLGYIAAGLIIFAVVAGIDSLQDGDANGKTRALRPGQQSITSGTRAQETHEEGDTVSTDYIPYTGTSCGCVSST